MKLLDDRPDLIAQSGRGTIEAMISFRSWQPNRLLVFALVAPLAALVLLAGCSGEPEDDSPPDDNAGAVDIPDEPTYHEHIAPLVHDHCTGCHTEDAIAPFALESFEEVQQHASLSHATMQAGTMPPWPPAEDCGDFRGERRMHPTEIELFGRWLDQGAVAGEQSDEQLPDHSEDIDDAQPDLTVDTGVDYTPEPPEGFDDDYRCFVVDPDLDGDRFVNSVDTRPGNPQLVHHMIAYTAPPEADDEIAALKAEDDRPGYECFGSPRYSGSRMIGGWVPGAQRPLLEEGHGLRVPEDSRIVVQMHYTTHHNGEGSDRTEVDFFFVDEQQHPDPTELIIMRLAEMDMLIDAGDPDATVTAETPLIPQSVTVHGIAPHMHLLGTNVRVDATTGDGDICLIDIPDWDFHWQGLYLYEEPMQLARPFRIELTCEYDNSEHNQPDGQPPRDVTWGDESTDEMCVALIVAEVPDDLEL